VLAAQLQQAPAGGVRVGLEPGPALGDAPQGPDCGLSGRQPHGALLVGRRLALREASIGPPDPERQLRAEHADRSQSEALERRHALLERLAELPLLQGELGGRGGQADLPHRVAALVGRGLADRLELHGTLRATAEHGRDHHALLGQSREQVPGTERTGPLVPRRRRPGVAVQQQLATEVPGRGDVVDQVEPAAMLLQDLAPRLPLVRPADQPGGAP
jgi:hypothetical protein